VKILILKFKTIGDVLLITPLVQNLKFKYPTSLIDISVNLGTEDVLTPNPNIHNVLVYKRYKNQSLSIFKKIYKEYKFLKNIHNKKYDIVIDLDQGDRGAIISRFSGAKIQIGSNTIKSRIIRSTYTHFLPNREKRHIVELNLEPLRLLSIPIVNKNVSIYWSKKDEKVVSNFLSSIHTLSDTDMLIHIHPFSRGEHKEIKLELVAKIIDFCEMELNTKVVITAAPEKSEMDKVHNIIKLCKSSPINLSGQLTLKQTAALNKKAKLFIGVDTAIMHISAANDTPVLAFFGPSGANHWGAWDNSMMQSYYTKNNGFQTMGKHRVFSESRECQPCGKDGCNGTKISDCLMNLDIDVIKKNIQGMVNGKNN